MITVLHYLLEDTMYDQDTTVLQYTINYPQLQGGCSQEAVDKINKFFKTRANAIEQHNRTALYNQARSQCELAKGKGYPCLPDETAVNYTVTLNEDCIFSLYFDHYLYTGGAHGTTRRCSATWDLNTGHLIRLKDFFDPQADYANAVPEYICHEIQSQLSGTKKHPDYFKNFERNVAMSFSPCSFYLTPDGIVLYFQQYEIAPYSDGIIEFQMPYRAPMRDA